MGRGEMSLNFATAHYHWGYLHVLSLTGSEMDHVDPPPPRFTTENWSVLPSSSSFPLPSTCSVWNVSRVARDMLQTFDPRAADWGEIITSIGHWMLKQVHSMAHFPAKRCVHLSVNVLIFTFRVRSTREGTVFHRCLFCSHFLEAGYPIEPMGGTDCRSR